MLFRMLKNASQQAIENDNDIPPVKAEQLTQFLDIWFSLTAGGVLFSIYSKPFQSRLYQHCLLSTFNFDAKGWIESITSS